jgi:hypothetical protein
VGLFWPVDKDVSETGRKERKWRWVYNAPNKQKR